MLGISSGNHLRLRSPPLDVRDVGRVRMSPSRIRNGRDPISDCLGFAGKADAREWPPSGIPPVLVSSNRFPESYFFHRTVS